MGSAPFQMRDKLCPSPDTSKPEDFFWACLKPEALLGLPQTRGLASNQNEQFAPIAQGMVIVTFEVRGS